MEAAHRGRRARLCRLESQVGGLQERLHAAQQEHQQQQQHLQLLVGLWHTLSMVQRQHQAQSQRQHPAQSQQQAQPQAQQQALADQLLLASLLPAERETFLRELSCHAGSAGSGDSSGSSAPAPCLEAARAITQVSLPGAARPPGWQVPVAPECDQLLLARDVLALPPDPELLRASLAALQQRVSTCCCRLALRLQQLEVADTPCQRQQLLGSIEAELRGYLRLLSTVVQQRPGVFLQLLCSDVETGDQATPDLEHYRCVARALQLSAHQKQRLALSFRVGGQLLASLACEHRQLQASLDGQGSADEAAGAAGSSCGGASGGGAGSGGTSGSSSSGSDSDNRSSGRSSASTVQLPRASTLAQQQACAERLQLCRRKDYFIRLVMSFVVFGALSWPQAAKFVCLSSPGLPVTSLLARVVVEASAGL